MRLTFSARDVLGQPLTDVALNVSASPGGAQQVVMLPGQLDVPDNVIGLELQIPVSSMMPWRAGVLFSQSAPRWRTSDPTVTLTENAAGADLVITLSRVRLAPVRANNPEEPIPFTPNKVMPVDFNPQGALVDVDGARYRDVFLTKEKVHTIDYPGIGDPAATAWPRFNARTTTVEPGARGCFVLLEYGDPPSKAGGLRFIVGVWAPFQFAGKAPVAIVQLTPNTAPQFGYPLDAPPFGRIYPYALTFTRRPPTRQELDNQHVALKELGQPYCQLPSNRTLVTSKALYQVYAARPDIFGADTDQGPVMITPVPAALSTKDYVQRAPFDNPQGLGRLVREVLHFLTASRLCSPLPGNRPRLRFRPPATDVLTMPTQLPVPAGPPDGRARITVLTHSAGIFALLPLVQQGGPRSLPALFPAANWGAPETDFTQDWRGLWLIDGVGNPGRVGSPFAGSDTARALCAWAGSGTRRLVAVYTESGIASDQATGLVAKTTRKAGPHGWIEEGRSGDGSITWLRMTDGYLAPKSSPDGAVPVFGDGPDAHNFIYYIGVGYAAAASGAP